MTIRRELFAGEVLYAQGDASDCAWLIERGAVELVSVHGRRETRRGVLGPGELIGEIGLLDGSPRTDTATARGDTVLLAIEPDISVCSFSMSDSFRLNCSPQITALSAADTSSALIFRSSPRCVTRPVSTALTFSSLPMVLASAAVPLYLNTEPRDITRSSGTWDSE